VRSCPKAQARPPFPWVIPLYRSSGSVEALVTRLEGLAVQEPWEVIFLDDGSPDDTVERLRRRLDRSSLQGLLVRHGRNDGEHNAVLTGYRHCRGSHVLNLDETISRIRRRRACASGRRPAGPCC
jgi:undecaprenyl-phosphate 4-deoxy-4-formamido-L-arabinose transferase